jgi:sugar-specific transcriptional regulator TrmB
LSLERIIKTLESFGFKRIEAEVYVYLAKKGPLKTEKIAAALKLSKQKLYPILKNLQNKDMVTVSPQYHSLFFAVEFEKVLDMLVKADLEQAQTIKETNKELLSSWRSITKRDNA